MNALELLAAHGDDAKVLSGGQSLMPAMNLRLISPELIVDIGGIAELKGIAVKGDVLTIGALTRHVDLQRSSEIAAHAPLLTEAIAHVAHPAIRNKGTIGGSLAHADPASELPACMVALDATIVIRGQTGERRVAARDFFTGIYETALSADELLAAVELPVARKEFRALLLRIRAAAWRLRHRRRRGAGDHGWRSVRRPSAGVLCGRRSAGTGQAALKLINVAITPEILSDASTALEHELDPPEDQQATPSMRRHLAKVLLRRCVADAAGPARSRRRGTRVTAHMQISLDVNGERVDAHVLPRLNLADFLREHLQLTGTHVGCEHGVCGACTVRVNGDIVRSCLMLAVQTDNASVETIEGLSDSGEIADLQAAFRDRNALQCGFCTPGMLMAAQDLLKQCTAPDREQIREHLSGNYCRCTGYQAIIDAVETTARLRAGANP